VPSLVSSSRPTGLSTVVVQVVSAFTRLSPGR
jgi:hypothetical protein